MNPSVHWLLLLVVASVGGVNVDSKSHANSPKSRANTRPLVPLGTDPIIDHPFIPFQPPLPRKIDLSSIHHTKNQKNGSV